MPQRGQPDQCHDFVHSRAAARMSLQRLRDAPALGTKDLCGDFFIKSFNWLSWWRYRGLSVVALVSLR